MVCSGTVEENLDIPEETMKALADTGTIKYDRVTSLTAFTSPLSCRVIMMHLFDYNSSMKMPALKS